MGDGKYREWRGVEWISVRGEEGREVSLVRPLFL